MFEALVCCLKGIWVNPYHSTSRVGPRFGNSMSIMEWKWWHYTMFEADIHLRPLPTSLIHVRHLQNVWASGILSQGHMGAPFYHSTGQVGPRFGNSGLLMDCLWCHNVMVKSVILFKLLSTSKLDIYKVFEPLFCCLKGIWVNPNTIPPAELAPDLGILCHLWSGNDGITPCLRLTFNTGRFPHPY